MGFRVSYAMSDGHKNDNSDKALLTVSSFDFCSSNERKESDCPVPVPVPVRVALSQSSTTDETVKHQASLPLELYHHHQQQQQQHHHQQCSAKPVDIATTYASYRFGQLSLHGTGEDSNRNVTSASSIPRPYPEPLKVESGHCAGNDDTPVPLHSTTDHQVMDGSSSVSIEPPTSNSSPPVATAVASPEEDDNNNDDAHTTTSEGQASAAYSPSPREKFLIFVKILFKCLDQAHEPEVRLRAKKIVAECTRRNRMGDPKFAPLMEAVEKRLRTFVGEVQWRRALLLLHHYLAKRAGVDPSF